MPHVRDHKHAVAMQFASRPTLRQVAGQQIMKVMIERYPLIARHRPELTSAEAFKVMIPKPGGFWSVRPFVDYVLQAWLKGERLDFSFVDGLDYRLSLEVPSRFYAIKDPRKTADGDRIKLEDLGEALNDLLELFDELFCQAQVDYWREDASAGVSRDRWLQQTVKSALLENLALQNLDAEQQACIRDLLAIGARSAGVCILEVHMKKGDQAFSRLLPNLLVMAENDARKVFLWCAPSSVIQAFDSLDAFAQALQGELVDAYDFETLTWDRHELAGDVFAQWAAAMLEALLAAARRLQHTQLTNVDEAEQVLAALTDPSQYFIDGYRVATDTHLALPSEVQSASHEDSFAYQCALFDLALAQAQSEGVPALADVLSLHAYASQRLREQLLKDHPIDANYFPDDLELTLTQAHGTPGGAGVGVGDGSVERRSMTLTEFAIGNLSSLQGAQLTGITHREGQLIMDWMTVDYAKSLVQRVDIGAHYPAYVAKCLDDPATREQRVERFAREWRCGLLFSALSAKRDGTLDDEALQCVVDFCRGDIDETLPATMLMPLAFKREPKAKAEDRVGGMYVLFCAQPSRVLLYRPLYADAPLMIFSSLDAMMQAIGQKGALQDSVLQWLAADARPVYAHGGFHEPHLIRPILDTSLTLLPVKPVKFAPQYWRIDVDAKLYQANRDLLVELANRQSVSNAESRWAILSQGAWLLFDVATLFLRGPVATVAWVIQAINAVSNDVAALSSASAFSRSSAVVDLLLNASMALMHQHLPTQASTVTPRMPQAPAFAQHRLLRPTVQVAAIERVQGKVGLPGSLGRLTTQLDFTWRGAHGLNVLPAERRQALLAMRSDVSLGKQPIITAGARRGLYEIAGHHYLTFAGDVYQAQVSEDGIRIMDPSGGEGPRMTFIEDGWRIDHALQLRGGMPKSRVQKLREKNEALVQALRLQDQSLTEKHNTLTSAVEKHRTLLSEKDQRIEQLEAMADRDALTERDLELTRELRKKINQTILRELKALIDNGVEHDQVLSQLADMRLSVGLSTMVGEAEDLARASRVVIDLRNATRQELIENLSEFYDGMAQMINSEDLDSLAKDVVVKPESKEEIRQYERFRKRLEQVIEWETQLIEMSRVFDIQLSDTLKDTSIVFKDSTGERVNKDGKLREIIQRRRLSAIDLEFQQLMDLAEASLDRLADVDEPTLAQYSDYLANDALKSAGNAHGDLPASGVSLSEQIEVLTGVVEAYQEAHVLADYLESCGGPAVKLSWLQRYASSLENIKSSAERDLAQAVRELELEEPPVPRTSTYAGRGGRRHVVRTNRGRSVLGEEVQIGDTSVMQQRDYRTQTVIKTFHKTGEQWVESSAQPSTEGERPVPSADPRIVRKKAQTLVDQVDSVVKLARLYVKTDEPNGLSTVIDGHLDKLKQAQAGLPRLTPEDELFEALNDAATRLKSVKRDLLTGMYLSTSHPTADSLRFLFDQRAITVQRAGERKALSASDYLEVYEIRRRIRSGEREGEGLWEAHFHYPSDTTPARKFSRGHLKLWTQRKLGRKAQLQAAASGRDFLAIYRGELRLEQIDGIIPF